MGSAAAEEPGKEAIEVKIPRNHQDVMANDEQ